MNKTLVTTVIAAVILALGLGLFFGNYTKVDLSKLQTATVLSPPRAIENFNFIDNEDQPFTQQNLRGHWTMLYFGFTNCPHICPMALLEINKAYQLMQQAKIPAPQVVLISLDPARDTIARLNTYIKAFNPAFKAARGSEAEVKQLTGNLNVMYLKTMEAKNSNDKNYDIDHSGSIFLISPKGEWIAIFSMPHQSQQIAHDFGMIQKYFS